MAATKRSKNKKKLTGKKAAKKPSPKQRPTYAELQQQLAEALQQNRSAASENMRLLREVEELLEQQTATSEILRVIASSPTDIQPVLDVVAENAARLCDASDTLILRVAGDTLQTAARFGPIASAASRVISRGFPGGRAVIDQQTIHVHDMAAAVETEFPDARILQQISSARTTLATPLLQEGISIGSIVIRRQEVRPFSEKQIALLKTFADQAVIAIENVRLFKELTEALEQQTATSEILGVIASSPTDIQPVLNTVAANAARLCEATDAQIRLVEGDHSRLVASFGNVPAPELRPTIRGTVSGRAIFNRETVHVHDLQEATKSDFPESVGASFGVRTMLCTPMIREGSPIGVITVRRTEVRPFSDKQIKLLETFADQAVIAIENVRLFNEIQERNAELRQALEHQTATSEVLSIISRSPTDVQPVLDAIVESAARVCGIDDVILRLHEGNNSVQRAHFGPVPNARTAISIDEPQYNWIREHGTLHIPDVREQTDFPILGSVTGARTFLIVPLRQHRDLIGALVGRRMEVRPFTPAQINLVETFADQAVIALENVRLFQELKESLEQQTATSEILGVIASSPTDVQPVLDVVAENAARLCDSTDSQIYRVDGDTFERMAVYGPMSVHPAQRRPFTRGSPTGRAVTDRKTIHVHDVAAELETEYPDAPQRITGTRSIVATPLLREGIPIGVINIRRTEVRPFSDRQIKLLETFATQAVIAIENVRLFKEIQERNSELREALEHQTATSEVLGIISRSPTDVQPVLDAIVESAVRVCGVDDVVLRLKEGDMMIARAHFGPIPIGRGRGEMSVEEPRYQWMREHGTLHIPDRRQQDIIPTQGSVSEWRTWLGVPLYQQEALIGGLMARRLNVRPFTPAQIKLLETFADQAVIAIENVRLFNELKESLEQQTATSRILGVIARSPTDIQPVLDVVAENAARLCEANDAQISRVDGDLFGTVASFGPLPPTSIKRPLTRTVPSGRAIIDRQIIHIPDLEAVRETEFPDTRGGRRPGHTPMVLRTVLAMPLCVRAPP